MKVFDPTINPVTGNTGASNGKANKPDSKVSYQTAPEEASVKVKWCIRELHSKGIDITQDYHDWIKLGFAFTELGPQGRTLFHELSSIHCDYDYDGCDRKYDELSKISNGSVGLGTFFKYCSDEGVRYNSDEREDPVFWIIDSENVLKILWVGLYDFLSFHGYCTLIYLETKIHARIQNNIVTKVDCIDIKHFVLDWVDKHLDPGIKAKLKAKLLQGANVFFGKGNISSLRPVNFNPLRSTKDTAYFPYRNGIVKATTNKIELTPYKDCNFHVWESQIIERDFTLENADRFKKDFYFFKFLQNITGGNEDRLYSLLSYTGFMLHPYRDPAKPQVLVFYDQQISDSPQGGTGKGIVAQAIGQIKTMVTIDGKNFKADNQFCWQRVGMDTQLVVFQDTTKWFKFDRLHSVITDGMVVNPKHSSEFFIPYSDSPKFIINTNYILDAEGASNKRRMKEVEFEPYYHATFTPENEFKELFFHSWDNESWLKFDNLMMDCVQSFLENGFIDPSVSSKTKSVRLFLQKFGEDTLEFIESLEDGEELPKLETFKKYKDEVGETMKHKITSMQFYDALKSVSGASDIITEVEFGRDEKSKWFKLVKTPF